MAHTERIDGKLVLRDDWHVEDVLGQAPWLSEDQAEEILEILADKHDANIGINWENIDFWVDYTYPMPDGYAAAEDGDEQAT